MYACPNDSLASQQTSKSAALSIVLKVRFKLVVDEIEARLVIKIAYNIQHIYMA